MISSPLMTGSYERTVPDYTSHNDREILLAEDTDGIEETDALQPWASTDPSVAGSRP
jgi:hypothetical protein